MPKSDYYAGLRARMPKAGWTCFHCDETLTTPGSAEDHFGTTPGMKPACQIKAGEERGLVMELRKAEALAAEYLDRAQRSEEHEESLAGEVAAFQHIAGGGLNELRCKIDSWQGEAITGRRMTDAVLQKAPDVWREIAQGEPILAAPKDAIREAADHLADAIDAEIFEGQHPRMYAALAAYRKTTEEKTDAQ